MIGLWTTKYHKTSSHFQDINSVPLHPFLKMQISLNDISSSTLTLFGLDWVFGLIN